MSFLRYSDIGDSKIDEKDYLRTGIKEYDRLCLGFGKGQLTIVSGTRGGGKSSLLDQIKLNFVDGGHKGIAFNLEMTPKREKQWLMLQACGKDNLKSETTRTGKTLYLPKSKFVTDKICEWLGDKLYINDNSTYRFSKIKSEIEDVLKYRSDIDFIIIDNLFRMDIGDFGNDKWQAQTKIAKELQALCQKHNIALVLVCHPTKVKTCPRIEDVSGSGDLINACDNCIIIHRVTNDFKYRAKEYFGWRDEHPLFDYDTIFFFSIYRDFGEEGTLLGLYFERETKRFLNYPNEYRRYGWESGGSQISMDEEELPF